MAVRADRQIVRAKVPFFSQKNVHRVIEDIAAAQSLTIFAGAGVSRDRGSPDWMGLVEGLLNKYYGLGAVPDTTQTGVKEFVAATPALLAASAVRELHATRKSRLKTPELVELIAQDLYDLIYGAWKPGGPLAISIVRLALVWKSLGRDVAIVTTNYDSNLEDSALNIGQEDEFRGLSLQPFVEDGRVGAGVVPVYHLHGYIPHEGDRHGVLAFSERGLVLGDEVLPRTPTADSAASSRRLDWRRKVLERRLKTSTTVFVGAALTDRTVADCLVRTLESGHRRYAVFPRQADPWISSTAAVRDQADEILEARLRHLDVIPLRPDFFGQAAQLLTEVVQCRVNGGIYAGDDAKPHRYGPRLVTWSRAWQAMLRSASSPNVHADNAQLVLDVAYGRIKALLAPSPSERLKVELWVRREPARYRQLQLWASSETSDRRHGRGHVAEICNNSSYAAVRAFCKGYVESDDLPNAAARRWASYCSVPVVLTSASWHGLTTGVISVVSSRPKETSAIGALEDAATFQRVIDELSAFGELLLSPTGNPLADDGLSREDVERALAQLRAGAKEGSSG